MIEKGSMTILFPGEHEYDETKPLARVKVKIECDIQNEPLSQFQQAYKRNFVIIGCVEMTEEMMDRLELESVHLVQKKLWGFE